MLLIGALNAIRNNNFILFVFGPFVELHYDCLAIFFLKRRVLQNYVHAVVTLSSILFGGIYFSLIDKSNLITHFGEMTRLPKSTQVLLDCYLGAWLAGYPVSILCRMLIKYILASECCFGDAEYYLDNKRLAFLTTVVQQSNKEILKNFNKLRAILKDDVTGEYNITSVNAVNILEILMFSKDADSVMYKYHEMLRKYYIWNWKKGYTQEELSRDNLIRLANLYKQSEQKIEEILKYCFKSLADNSGRASGARQDDFILIVEKILSGDHEGLEVFYKQQYILYRQRINLEYLQEENTKKIQHLQDLRAKKIFQKNRQSLSSSNDSSPVFLPFDRLASEASSIEYPTAPSSVMGDEVEEDYRIENIEAYEENLAKSVLLDFVHKKKVLKVSQQLYLLPEVKKGKLMRMNSGSLDNIPTQRIDDLIEIITDENESLEHKKSKIPNIAIPSKKIAKCYGGMDDRDSPEYAQDKQQFQSLYAGQKYLSIEAITEEGNSTMGSTELVSVEAKESCTPSKLSLLSYSSPRGGDINDANFLGVTLMKSNSLK